MRTTRLRALCATTITGALLAGLCATAAPAGATLLVPIGNVRLVDSWVDVPTQTVKAGQATNANLGSYFSGLVTQANAFNPCIGALFAIVTGPCTYHAFIQWGDGALVDVRLGGADGTIQASHAYQSSGAFTVNASVVAYTASGSFELAHTDTVFHVQPRGFAVNVNSLMYRCNSGQAAVVAKLVDQDNPTNTDPSALEVNVDWGDGTTSVGKGWDKDPANQTQINGSGTPGTFDLYAQHEYDCQTTTTYHVHVTLTDHSRQWVSEGDGTETADPNLGGG